MCSDELCNISYTEKLNQVYALYFEQHGQFGLFLLMQSSCDEKLVYSYVTIRNLIIVIS